ncbi:MAG TPA: asparagine synthase-related protein, partial [Candidatus Acidoferrales bacterium]|nr:asparagine synthase-related protein [Candidatus Acidoferrales bacterium]
LSDSEKRHAERPKALLVAALGDLLPEEVVMQRKRTFTLPWEKWLRGPLRERVAANLSDWAPSLEALIPRKAAGGVWNAFVAGRTSWSRAWSLHVLNAWVKRQLEGGASEIASVEAARPAKF